MGFLSHDGGALLGLGHWSLCVECGEGTREGDERRHAPGCPRAASPASRALRPAAHPRSYVLTDRGIEREADVERRRDSRRDR